MKIFSRLMLVLSVQIPTGLSMSALGYGDVASFVATVFTGALLLFSVQNLIGEPNV